MVVGGWLKGDLANAIKRLQVSRELLELVARVTDAHPFAASAGQFNEDVGLGFSDINGYQSARGCSRVRSCHARYALRVVFFSGITPTPGRTEHDGLTFEATMDVSLPIISRSGSASKLTSALPIRIIRPAPTLSNVHARQDTTHSG